jgi:hypothetical protein
MTGADLSEACFSSPALASCWYLPYCTLLAVCCYVPSCCSTYTRLLRRKLGLTAVEEEGDRALGDDVIQVRP